MHSFSSAIRHVNLRALFSVVFLGSLCYYAGWLSRWPAPEDSALEWKDFEAKRVTITVQAPQATVTVIPEAEEAVVLNGSPTDAFQDNLRHDVRYITTWPGTGFSKLPNEAMSLMNLIYLAMLTERVPILPAFNPSHLSGGSPDTGEVVDTTFGEVFDVPRLAKELRMPILEWWQVKDRKSTTVDSLGCWNVWQATMEHSSGPQYSVMPRKLNIDISWTIAPKWVKLKPDAANEAHAKFTGLMALAFPEQRNRNLRTPSKSPLLGLSLPPNEQLLCFDNLYYTANVEGFEFERDYSTAWRLVGKHLHWNPRIEEIARGYVRRTFGLGVEATIPPYIAIHVRHGDFKGACHTPLDECFAPLSAIARRVNEVKEELQRLKDITAVHIILTSDETNITWWEEVAAYGWYRIDHSATASTYGAWYPVLIDTAIQSEGKGFVGTDRSTVSLIAGRRVEEWNDGVLRSVKWGKVGADDHQGRSKGAQG
ncbi:hypothetical protein B0H16DRAFT_1518426 [Mycena metata]|uniref:Uncharacterized protein n=1 Tax=Mycena metata TaxID=1033252 RepID=A0AAD7JNZ8_9AGAR|nr:hypothetical protein B0H16DRAFT_1518426 [Mycena metata]